MFFVEGTPCDRITRRPRVRRLTSKQRKEISDQIDQEYIAITGESKLD